MYGAKIAQKALPNAVWVIIVLDAKPIQYCLCVDEYYTIAILRRPYRENVVDVTGSVLCATFYEHQTNNW